MENDSQMPDPNPIFQKHMNSSVSQRKDDIDELLDDIESWDVLDYHPTRDDIPCVTATMQFKPDITKGQVEHIVARLSRLLDEYRIWGADDR